MRITCDPVTFNSTCDGSHENESLPPRPPDGGFGAGCESTSRKAQNIPGLIFCCRNKYQVWKHGSRNLLSDCLLFSHCSCVIKQPRRSLAQRLLLLSSELTGRKGRMRRKPFLKAGPGEQSAEPPPWSSGTGT